MVEKDMNQLAPGEQAPGVPMRNPYIMKFCKALVEKKGETHEPEAMQKLLEDMYGLFEFLLGQNMIKALPDGVREEYLKMANDLQNLSYEKIGNVFDKNVPDYESVMKETMRQFTTIFMKNRQFKAADHMPQ